MDPTEASRRIEEHGVIPVLVFERVESALGLADALIEGGLPIAEVTFRTEAAAAVLRTLHRERPDLLLGAGTVLTPENAALAAECGASFILAPGMNPAVVRRAADLGVLVVPGIFTPSEVERALEIGCRLLKVFPADLGGGVRLIQALTGPYRHTGVRFVPTGGVTLANLGEYLRVETVAAAGGTWIAKKEDIAGARWSDIRTRCRDTVAIVREARAR